MDDITERLRNWAEDGPYGGCSEYLIEAADEIERLRSALREIADDPYQQGQRVQRMKRIARAVLGEDGR